MCFKLTYLKRMFLKSNLSLTPLILIIVCDHLSIPTVVFGAQSPRTFVKSIACKLVPIRQFISPYIFVIFSSDSRSAANQPSITVGYFYTIFPYIFCKEFGTLFLMLNNVLMYCFCSTMSLYFVRH